MLQWLNAQTLFNFKISSRCDFKVTFLQSWGPELGPLSIPRWPTDTPLPSPCPGPRGLAVERERRKRARAGEQTGEAGGSPLPAEDSSGASPVSHSSAAPSRPSPVRSRQLRSLLGTRTPPLHFFESFTYHLGVSVKGKQGHLCRTQQANGARGYHAPGGAEDGMLLGTARPEAPSHTRHDGDPGSWMAPPAGAADRDPRPPRPVPRAPPRLKPARSNGRAPSRRLPGAFPP